jgi:hypothetical protein
MQHDLHQFADRPVLQTTALLSDMGMTGGMAIGALGFAALKTAGHFQQMTQAVAGNTNMTKQQLATMREGVRRIAMQTGGDMKEIAGGYMRAINEGFKQSGKTWRTESQFIVDAATKSAVSAGANIEDVTNALAISMHDFGYKGREAINVMNALHTASAEGNMRLEDMAKNFAQVASLAHSTGVSFADAATAMAVLTRTGMTASRAQTQISGLFFQMLHPSPEAKQQLMKLAEETGVDVVKAFSQAGLKEYGLGGVTRILDVALKKYAELHHMQGMPTEELSSIITQRRGVYGVLEMLQSLQNARTPQGAHVSYEQIMGDVMRAGGMGPTGAITGQMVDPETHRRGSVTDRLFRAMIGTQEGRISQLRAHMNNLLIDLGGSIRGPFIGAIREATKLIDRMDSWVRQPGHRELIANFFKWGIAIGAASAAMRGLIGVYSSFSLILRMSPWIAAAAGFIYLYNKSKPFHQAVNSIAKALVHVTNRITNFTNSHQGFTQMAIKVGAVALAAWGLYRIFTRILGVAHAFSGAVRSGAQITGQTIRHINMRGQMGGIAGVARGAQYGYFGPTSLHTPEHMTNKFTDS